MRKYSELETALIDLFKVLEIEFSKLLKENNINISLRSNAYVNDNGVGAGWLSCSKDDPTKESLELIASFNLKNINTILEYDIYWSDGSCVEELYTFDLGSSEKMVKLIDEINKSFNAVQKTTLSRYLYHLIENIDKI